MLCCWQPTGHPLPSLELRLLQDSIDPCCGSCRTRCCILWRLQNTSIFQTWPLQESKKELLSTNAPVSKKEEVLYFLGMIRGEHEDQYRAECCEVTKSVPSTPCRGVALRLRWGTWGSILANLFCLCTFNSYIFPLISGSHLKSQQESSSVAHKQHLH